MLMDGLAMLIHVGLLTELDGEVTMPQLLLHRSPVSIAKQHWQCMDFCAFLLLCLLETGKLQTNEPLTFDLGQTRFIFCL